MRHLFTAWPEISPKLAGQNVFLFLDYDGTLTPIVATPDAAVFANKGRTLLRRLVGMQGLRIAVVSGRALKDVKQRVGVEGVIYSGNHGLEAEGPGFAECRPEAVGARQAIAKLRNELQEQMLNILGVSVEDKSLSLSVHFRNVSPAELGSLTKIFRQIVDPAVKLGTCVVREGKMVWEVRPPVNWTKGNIVRWLLNKTSVGGSEPFLPCYVGDDQTDEDAFRELRSGGVTVKVDSVGSGPSSATYFLKTPDEVFIFLERIANVRRQKP